MDESALIPANSPSFEYVYVANQRCDCGGVFATVRQELCGSPSSPVDRIVGCCETCGAERTFDFDVHSFFGQFEKYSHFHQTDDRFREAMAHVRAGRLAEAEAALRRVVDPEEGEPAFAWGRHHLGMVLLRQERPDEAVVHLEQAQALQPLEPDIYEGLAQAYSAVGRGAEATACFQRAEELRMRFADPPPSQGG
jgi:tetratricopeptide (TPR) repeat protein